MTISYNQAAFPTFQLVYPESAIPTLIGKPMATCRMFTYKSTDHATFKTAYSSNIGSPPPAQTNPIVLDGNGQATVYFAFDDSDPTDLYYVVVMGIVGDDSVYYAWDDFNGAPVSGGGGPSVSQIATNYVRNPQFTIWDHFPVQETGGSVLNTTYFDVTADDLVCDDWFFFKNATTGTDSISRQAFAPGQTDVAGDPSFFLRYDCTIAATTETTKYLSQRYKNVQFLNGESICHAFYARANTNTRQIVVNFVQYFGTGGSPSTTVITPIQTFTLTSSWAKYSIEDFTIPSIQGKTIGTNRDDYCYLAFNLDINVVSTYDFCNVQLEEGATLSPFVQNSASTEQANLSPVFQVPTGHGQLIFNVFTTSYYGRPNSGWIPLADQTLAKPQAAVGTIKKWAVYNLYCEIWNSYLDAQAPVSTGRGANPVADWNAGKNITVPLTMGRSIGNYGAGSGLTPRVAGLTTGTETSAALLAHTHTLAPVPTATSGFTAVPGSITSPPDVSNFCATANPAESISNLTITGSSGSGATFSLMHPVSYLPYYIHI